MESDWHRFRDGDYVTIRYRLADGTVGEDKGQFAGLVNDESGKTCFEYYLWRPDGTSRWFPVEQLVGLTLERPVPPEEADPPQ